MTDSSLQRAMGVLRKQGLSSLLIRMLRKAFHPVVRIDRLIFFTTDLTKDLPPFDARIPIEIRPATPEDFRTFASTFERIGIERHEIQRRVDRGDVAFLALAGGVLAHSQWITSQTPWVSEIHASLVLGPWDVCAYEAVTLPEWRGHGIHPAVSRMIREHERARGRIRHISWAWASNFESLRTIGKLARPTRKVWSVWVFGMRRAVALGLRRDGFPRLVRSPAP